MIRTGHIVGPTTSNDSYVKKTHVRSEVVVSVLVQASTSIASSSILAILLVLLNVRTSIVGHDHSCFLSFPKHEVQLLEVDELPTRVWGERIPYPDSMLYRILVGIIPVPGSLFKSIDGQLA